MNIIHFDLGSHMAFAHNGCTDIGLVECDHFDVEGPRAVRAAKILAWLIALKDRCEYEGIKFDVAHYERPFARGFDATRCGWGIAGLIEAVFGNDCVVLDTTPQSIKSFALGSKKIARKKMTSAERRIAAAEEKLAMIVRAQELGYTGNNEHEADAFLGLKYAETYCQKEIQWNPKISRPSTKNMAQSSALPGQPKSRKRQSAGVTRRLSSKA
jgi:hypothetical protein